MTETSLSTIIPIFDNLIIHSAYCDSGSIFAASPKTEGGREVEDKETLQPIAHGGD